MGPGTGEQRSKPEMVPISGGLIQLRDEGKKTNWGVDLAPYSIGRYPVTSALYGRVRSADPVLGCGKQFPVVEITWFEAVSFCNDLSRQEGLSQVYSSSGETCACDWNANGYRLPSEAEWEYACRAGSTAVRYGELDSVAWYEENSGQSIHVVGEKEPNAWGLYDMLGNVWEWCWDLFDPEVYGPYRVFRGGGWCDPPVACRASCRRKSHPTFCIDDLGFRLARSLR